ncbi:hypothetical protein [Chroococcus sp. FPU101]|uniref:hypothetical protein n=1 Tax=Chroococcus sp. FPU101 TaxID=1974212 RepID=UPI001A8F85F3|nr:hypothetical protein [Chroococcus sp. FPU101]GFE68910.1 hypothetical protein CFPU101_15200 [Chroococcus sp. FPU101]
MKLFNQSTRFWLIASLIPPLYFGIITLFYALSQPYVVQDDARQHIIWFQQFIDSELFKNDLIFNYFQSVAPTGYKLFYWLGAKLGISPMLLAKIIPVFLAMITTSYFYKFSLIILPIPFSAFLSTLILNINIWLKDDLVSGTPRAFVYPIFAAFLYYLVRRSLILCLIIIALQGLFFPQLVFVQVLLLTIRLLEWKNNHFRFILDKTNYLFWSLGLVVSFLVLLPFALHISEFGSVITLEQMKQMPEYYINGRIEYFGFNPLFLPFKSSSGIGAPTFPPFIWLSLGLPFVLKKSQFLASLVNQELKILWQLLLASLIMYIAASIVPLRLYFPGRYTYHSLKFVMAISSAIVILALLNYFDTKLKQKFSIQTTKFILILVAIIFLLPAFTPALFLRLQEWRIGKNQEIYHFFASKPKDILIASLTPDTSNLPAFAQRSVLFSTEFALPIHPVYYNQMQQKAIDLIQAQYSSNLADIQNLIKKYGIDYLMIEPTFFNSDYLLQRKWLINSSFNDIVLKTTAKLKQNQLPALTQVINLCSVKTTEKLIVLDAECITKKN